MPRDLVFLLEDGHGQTSRRELTSGGEADDAGADDSYVRAFAHDQENLMAAALIPATRWLARSPKPECSLSVH
jgi:hypothetical protein